MNPQPAAQVGGALGACCFILVGVLGGAFFVQFYFGKDGAFKKKWFPRIMVLFGVSFGLFVTVMIGVQLSAGAAFLALLVTMPLLTMTVYLNIRWTSFCEQCGAMVFRQNPFVPTNYCPRCGASLNPKPKAEADPLE